MESNHYWKRWLRRKVSRRTALKAGAAIATGAAATAIVGCREEGQGPAPTPGTTPQVGPPRAGGVLVHGRSADPVTMDPHSSVTALDIIDKIYGYLYHVWPSTSSKLTEATPAMAETLEQPDELTFVFTLRRGVKFHNKPPVNGREATSDDVKKSFERRMTGLDVIDKRFPNVIDRLETPDPYTFRVIAKRPFWPAVNEMGNPTWGIIPVEAGEFDLAQEAIGTGPWTLEAFVRGERVRLGRHTEFFVPDRPYLDGHEYSVIPDQSSLLAAFRTKRHDVNGATLNPLVNSELEEIEGIILHKQPSLSLPVLIVRPDRSPFNDLRVRQAIDLAIDRQELIDTIVFGEGDLSGPIVPGHEFWALPQEELKQFYQPDTERARQLLREAGAEGTQVKLKTARVSAFWTDTATLIAQQLTRAGFKVEVEATELATWLTTVLLPGNFEMTFFQHLPYDEPDRPLSFYHSLGVSGGGNASGLRRDKPEFVQAGFSPEVDELIDKQQAIFDEEERQPIILEVQRKILQEHGPQFALFAPMAYTAFWDHIQGWRWGTAGADSRNWDIWTTKAPPAGQAA